jgi:hypothetical protein
VAATAVSSSSKSSRFMVLQIASEGLCLGF